MENSYKSWLERSKGRKVEWFIVSVDIYPWTMMIHFQHACATHTAMVRTIRFDDHTFLTISQHTIQCSAIEKQQIQTENPHKLFDLITGW